MVWTVAVEAEQAAQIEAAAARQGMTPEAFLLAAALRDASAEHERTQPQNGHAPGSRVTDNGPVGRVNEDTTSATVPSWAAPLAQAAQRHDEVGFIVALRDIDRARLTASDWQLLTQLALTAGAHRQARDLAQEGARRFADDAWLQRRTYLLAPPRLLRRTPVDPVAAAERRATREWMKAHRSEHRGEWVAVQGGQLLGTAPTLRELREKLQLTETEQVTLPFMTKIY